MNILSFDVEEWFQVSGLQGAISRHNWENLPSRVEASMSKILDMLDRHEVKATFFCLGWVAERHPDMIRRIVERGHEIACHGYDHKLIYHMTTPEFAEDIRRTADVLESITGQKVRGFRAPSFSMSAKDTDKFEALADLGITYDSSLFPMKHFRYGEATSVPLAPFDITDNGRVLVREFPMSIVKVMGKRMPAAGGGYFRLFPMFLLMRNIKIVEAEGRPAIVYLHPWEFDPHQPRISGASWGDTFRHYVNLDKTETKLEQILKAFSFGPFRDYPDKRAR